MTTQRDDVAMAFLPVLSPESWGKRDLVGGLLDTGFFYFAVFLHVPEKMRHCTRCIAETSDGFSSHKPAPAFLM